MAWLPEQTLADFATVARLAGVSLAADDIRIEALPAHHRLSAGGGTDNVVAITSCRYQASPLLVRGPGAGAAVTAAALLDDVLAIVALSTR